MRVKMFFMDRNYRSIVLTYAGTKIIQVVSTPFIYIYSLYKVYKLHKDYPNPWERHVKLREIANKSEMDAERSQVFKLQSQLITAQTCYIICMLANFYWESNPDITIENFAKNLADFDKFKTMVQSLLSELKSHKVIIPEELERLIETTKIDDYSTAETIEEYGKKLNGLIDSMFPKEDVNHDAP